MAPILGIYASGQQLANSTSYESIATVTVGAGGAASVSFTGIPSTYQHLQLRALVRTTNTTDSTGTYLNYLINSNTGANYDNHVLKGNGSSPEAAFVGASQTGAYLERFPGANQTANSFGVMVLDILDYANTSKYKTVRNLSGFDSNGEGQVGIFSTLWQQTTAISGLSFTPVSNNFAQYTSFALYGIKG